MAKLSGICVPAMLYLVLSIIAIIAMAMNKFELMSILVKVLFVAIWTWFLNFLCSQGYTVVSWFLVLLPFILFFLMLLFAYEIIKKHKMENFAAKGPAGHSMVKKVHYKH